MMNLLKTSECGYLEIVQLLIKKRADIHNKDNYAIVLASCEGHLSVVKLLIINY